MTLGISPSYGVLSALSNLNNLTSDISNLTEEESTGYAINSPADNPADYSMIVNFQTQIDGYNAASQNVSQAQDMVNTVSGGYTQGVSILQSMKTLATQALGGTLSQSQLSADQEEMNNYAKQLTTVANSTQFNGINLTDGSWTNNSMVIQQGPNAGDTFSMNFASMDATTLGVAGNQVTGVTTSGTLAAGVSSVSLASNNGSIDMVAAGQTSATYQISFSTNANGGISAQLQDSSGNNIGDAVALNGAGTYTLGSQQAGQQISLTMSGAATAGTTQSFTVNANSSDGPTYDANGNLTQQANTVAGLSIMNSADANTTLTAINNALNTLQGEQGLTGAYSNALTDQSNLLQTETTNTQSSLSNIQDANLTQVQAELTKDQSLAQLTMTAIQNQEQTLPSMLLNMMFPQSTGFMG